MSALSRELRETLDDPKRYDWGGPWEHIGDAERDVRALLDELDTIEEALGQALDQAAVLHAALARVIDIATRGVGPDTTAEEVNSTIAAYVVKRLSRLPAVELPSDQWFIPEGDRTCGVVHRYAKATCMKRRGHDGSHATPQGTWIDGPWCEYPEVESGL